MKGCVVFGKVQFQDGVVPSPVWPEGKGPAGRAARAPADEPERSAARARPHPSSNGNPT
jgi:hypothetical protein